jgi:hypothetical protein
VGFRQQICFDLMVGGDRVAFDDEGKRLERSISPALSQSRCRQDW